MEFLALIPFVLDPAVGWLASYLSEVHEDVTADWQCAEGICVDRNTVQHNRPWIYLTVKIPGETDQMQIDIDCSRPIAYIRSGRNRLPKEGLPDSVCVFPKDG